MYEHSVTIEKEDLNQVLGAAKFLKIDVDIAPAPVVAAKPAPANQK